MLAPTRELAQQITKVIESLKWESEEFRTLCTYGGLGLERQLEALATGIDIIVGTTGRTLDFLNRGAIDLSSLQAMVLDEADRMFENNFQDDIYEIFGGVPEEKREAV